MMLHKTIYDDGEYEWIVFGRDPEKPDCVIDTNQYLIRNSNEGILLDAGGVEVFPAMLNEVSKVIELEKIKKYICSHQDPDIMSSLPLWMSLTPGADIYLSWIWEKFVSHFGRQYADRFVDIPDEGMKIKLGNRDIHLVPAHYCHSSGNFSVYDPMAKILWSGDIGSALLPVGTSIFVENFEKHIAYMEAFHIRWMPSNEAKNRWVRRVRRLDVDMLCPQHGSIFKGADVKRFLDWFEALDVGHTKE